MVCLLLQATFIHVRVSLTLTLTLTRRILVDYYGR